MKLQSTQELHSLPQDEFDKLTPEQIRAMNSPSAEDNDEDQEDLDDSQEDDGSEESSTEDDEDNPSDDNEEDEEVDPEAQEEEDQGEAEDAATVIDDKPAKKKSKTKPSSESEQATEVDYKAFHDAITSKFKAAGVDIQITDPQEAISLMQRGADYTKKSQALAHLRGIDEVLKENDLLDPTSLSYLIDLKNHKPEAIARLIKESGIDPFDFDDSASASYKAAPIDFQAKARVANVREVVEAHSEDADFNEVFAEVRQWDESSQQSFVDDPTLLVQLASHKKDGTYARVIAEIQRQNVLGYDTKEPLLQRYVRTGHQMFGNPQGGSSAQVPKKGLNQQVPNTPRVVVRSSDVNQKRKGVAPTARSSSRGLSKLTVADINSMDIADLSKLSPDLLRKLK